MSATEPLVYLTALGEEGTLRCAADIASLCRTGDCLRLYGEVGAGKTTFARGFIQSLQGQAEEVVSPTFTLVQSYQTSRGQGIWHFDLYRLKSPAELQEIGLEDALQSGIVLVEWPDLARSILPTESLDVQIAQGDDPAVRHMVLRGADVWKPRLAALAKEY